LSKNIRIVFILLTVVLAFFLVMIFRFYNNVETAARKNDSGIGTESGNTSGMIVFRDESGLKGLKNGNGQIIIPARWSRLTSASSGKFIVSLTDGKTSREGVIDSSENIVIPVIYKKIVYDKYDSYYICTTEDSRYVLTDENGNALIKKEWDRYQKKIENKTLSEDGNYIELQYKNDLFRFCSQGDRLSVLNINLVRDLCGFQKQITIRGTGPDLRFNDIFDNYSTVVDNSIDYINAMFRSDITLRKKLTIESEYRDLSADEVDFKGGDLRYIDSVQPFIACINGQFSYSCNVSLMYAVPDSINFDGTYSKVYKAVSLNIQMKREQDGVIRISSVKANKIDIAELEIPDECFDPEDVPESPDAAVTDDMSETEPPVHSEETSAAVSETAGRVSVTEPAVSTDTPTVIVQITH